MARGIEPMHNRGSFHILLVHPPLESPAVPPLAPAKVAGFFSSSNLSIEQYDANLDFFLNYLLSPERLTGLLDSIMRRGKQGMLDDTDPLFSSLFNELETNPEYWARKIRGIKQSLGVLRAEDFYHPESCSFALKEIYDCLDLASLAYYPSRIKWGRFSNPYFRNISEAPSFVEDYNLNPFLLLCQEGLASRLSRNKPGLVMVFVSVRDQLPAALTIAAFCRKRYPGLHVALAGDRKLLAGAEPYGYGLLPDNDAQALCEMLGCLVGSTIVPNSAGPDFSGLPLKDYLAPAVVLPFEEEYGSKNDMTLSSRLMAYLMRQQQDLGVRGFISKDVHTKPAYIVRTGGETAETRQSFCISLTRDLHTPSGTENMVEAYEAGVRLIHWQHPKGELKTLTNLLWEVSRAHIWNHVTIDTETEGSLAQGLIEFMAANPNIVHSWSEDQRSPAPPDYSPLQPEQPSASYTQVVPLPGQPLWKRLNDPVYRLLYLDRHGIKKVMRWRVRNDHCSVYSLGENIRYHFVPPHELPAEYLDEICRMIEAGGSVGTNWVRYNLERAFLIGYAMEENIIVGNSSLKYPRPEYVEAVSRQSGLDLTGYLERGYTSVRPEYRGMGIGTRLLDGLTARVGEKKVYSVISSDNIATQKIAIRNNTRQVATFYSERLGKEIGVWIPAWMIED